jgi:hypothetical protein
MSTVAHSHVAQNKRLTLTAVGLCCSLLVAAAACRASSGNRPTLPHIKSMHHMGVVAKGTQDMYAAKQCSVFIHQVAV